MGGTRAQRETKGGRAYWVETVEATARTLTLPARRRRRVARGGEVQSVTSLRRSAILEAIGGSRSLSPPPPRSRALLLLVLLVTEIGMWVVVVARARAKQTAVREMGCPPVRSPPQVWVSRRGGGSHHRCETTGCHSARAHIYVSFYHWNYRFAPLVSLSSGRPL